MQLGILEEAAKQRMKSLLVEPEVRFLTARELFGTHFFQQQKTNTVLFVDPRWEVV